MSIFHGWIFIDHVSVNPNNGIDMQKYISKFRCSSSLWDLWETCYFKSVN